MDAREKQENSLLSFLNLMAVVQLMLLLFLFSSDMMMTVMMMCVRERMENRLMTVIREERKSKEKGEQLENESKYQSEYQSPHLTLS